MTCFIVACSFNEQDEIMVVLPDDIPDFVSESDFIDINWENKAIEFGDRGVIGNKNKSGVIGADMPSLEGQKWMWHLWGINNPLRTKLTVVGFHKETKTVHPILINDWTIGLAEGTNGADATMPSSIKIPKSGEWAILLYTNDKLFDTLIYQIDE
jgi:hypothetical protein